MNRRKTLALCAALLATLACLQETAAVTPSMLAEPTARTLASVERVELLATKEPTPYSVGAVLAGSLHIRTAHNFGEGEGSNVIGYLHRGDEVRELECWQSADGIVWVRHDLGWSVVASGGEAYIDGVCLNP